jgi:hypothetical protein
VLGGSWIFKELLVPAFEKNKIRIKEPSDSKYLKKTLKELAGFIGSLLVL